MHYGSAGRTEVPPPPSERAREEPQTGSQYSMEKGTKSLIRRAFATRAECRLGLALQHPAQEFDVFGERRIGLGQLLDFFDGMNHRRVVAAAEFAADLGQRARGQLLG